VTARPTSPTASCASPQGAKQRACFLDGHGEPDPFSMESHDHLEGAPGHTHGLGAQYVLHERHGMAKARHSLEAMNYDVEKVLLVRGGDVLAHCSLLLVAGPKAPLAPAEVAAVRAYLAAGGNAFFMLDPFRAHRARARGPGVRRGGGRYDRDRRGRATSGPTSPPPP